MTYKTRQEVLRAAADWMDVCESAGVEANGKHDGRIGRLRDMSLDSFPEYYEFPLTLLEGKEVWIGSELYGFEGNKFIAEEFIDGYFCEAGYSARGYGFSKLADNCSWNSPKPATVMVEMLVADAEWWVQEDFCSDRQVRVKASCKKALEKL